MSNRRLVLLFCESTRKIQLQKGDIVFTNDPLLKLNDYQVINLSLYDKADTDMKLYRELRAFFDKTSFCTKEMMNEIYYKILAPIIHCISQIDELIIQEKIDEIVLVGGSDYQFVSLNCAEGEGRKRAYRSSWMLNNFIYQYFTQYEHLKVNWEKKNALIIYNVFHVFREKIFLYLSLLTLLYKNLLLTLKKDFVVLLNIDEPVNIFYAELDLQYKHLRELAKFSKFKSIYILNRHIKVYPEDLCIHKEPVRMLDIMRFFHSVLKTGERKFVLHINEKEITILERSLRMGIAAGSLLALYEKESLVRTFNKIDIENVRCVVGDGTVGYQVSSLYDAGKKNGLKVVNFQKVSMQPQLYPDLFLADRYYLYNKETYSLYNRISDSFRFYLPMQARRFTGNLRERLVITIFTQPDSYTDRYLVAIDNILQVIQRLNKDISVRIKLHYRQDKIDKFEQVIKPYTFAELETEKDAIICLKKSDLVISMTSSVIFEALLNCIPALIINFDKLDDSIIKNGGFCVPEVNYVLDHPEDIFSVLNNFDKFTQQYTVKLDNYIGSVSGGIDFDEWTSF